MFFFFTHTAPTWIYTLSLHDALPISVPAGFRQKLQGLLRIVCVLRVLRILVNCSRIVRRDWAIEAVEEFVDNRTEEHTSELQSHVNLVCRLPLEKKKNNYLPTQTAPH